MADKIRVAMLGVGIHGLSHIKAVAALPELVELVAAADVHKEHLEGAAMDFGVAHRFTDARKAAEEADADAVIICLPNHLHAPVTLTALRAGKHVLVEKPMALTYQDAEEMVETAERCGKLLMSGQSLRFSSPHRKIKALLREGAVGEVRHVVHRRMSKGMGRPEDSWFGLQAQSGGILPGIGSHSIDAMLWWLEEDASRVYAEIRSLNPNIDIEDEVSITARTRSGVVLTMAFSFNFAGGQEWIICGDEGVLMLRGQELTLNGQPQDIPEMVELEGEGKLHQEFFTAIRDERALIEASGRHVLPSIAVICAAQESAMTGEVVTL